MKILFAFALPLVLLGCQKDQVEAQEKAKVQEEKAILLGYWYGSASTAVASACASGYQIQTESSQYRTPSLPAPFDKATNGEVSVWIRYQIVVDDNCTGSSKSIKILSIRER